MTATTIQPSETTPMEVHMTESPRAGHRQGCEAQHDPALSMCAKVRSCVECDRLTERDRRIAPTAPRPRRRCPAHHKPATHAAPAACCRFAPHDPKPCPIQLSETRKAIPFHSEAGYRERGLCPMRLAYRTMADTGSQARCGAKAVTPAGFCRRHDPETAPKRDKWGRILPSVKPAPRVVAEPVAAICWTCRACACARSGAVHFCIDQHGNGTGIIDGADAAAHRSLGHDVRAVQQ